MLYKIVQTLAKGGCIRHTMVAFITLTHITSNFIGACPMISTDIVKTFINIYRKQLTTDSYHTVNKFCNLHKCNFNKDRYRFIEVLPLHGLDLLGGNVGSVALNPSKQVQRNDPLVFAQLE